MWVALAWVSWWWVRGWSKGRVRGVGGASVGRARPEPRWSMKIISPKVSEARIKGSR